MMNRILLPIVLALALLSHQASALSGAVPGAIYWPAWNNSVNTTGNTASRQAQWALSPSSWQFRAPSYCVAETTTLVNCNMTQAVMDQQIQIAAAAGLKFWSFGWYGQPYGCPVCGDVNFQIAWNYYQSSAYKSMINWTATISPGNLGAASGWTNPNSDPTGDTAKNINQWVSYFGQSNFQTITDGTANRPVLFILYNAADITNYFAGSVANFATSISYLRSQAAAASLGNPYIVLMDGTGTSTHNLLAQIGGDALGGYSVSLSPAKFAGVNAYSSLDSAVTAYTTALAANGDHIVPILQTGADLRPRRGTPETYANGPPYAGYLQYYTAGTPSAIVAGQISSTISYINSNPTIVPSKMFLIYSWSENDEGGNALNPTIGDPPQTNPPYTGGQSTGLTNMLNAVGPSLWAVR